MAIFRKALCRQGPAGGDDHGEARLDGRSGAAPVILTNGARAKSIEVLRHARDLAQRADLAEGRGGLPRRPRGARGVSIAARTLCSHA